MLIFILIVLKSVFILPLWAADGPDWQQTLSNESGSYLVKVLPQKNKLEVKRVEGAAGAPPHMRLRILRAKDRPLEIRMHTLKTPDSLLYRGGVDRWQKSTIGFELEVSFDKKTWRKIGNILPSLFQ